MEGGGGGGGGRRGGEEMKDEKEMQMCYWLCQRGSAVLTHVPEPGGGEHCSWTHPEHIRQQ